MGKTSVLSALELGLTGAIAHLDRNQSHYREYLTNFDAQSGSIQLAVEGMTAEAARPSGSVDFSGSSFDAQPVLSPKLASFFAQRCYLPQAVLGRLLEMYDEQKKGAHSELTQFVKELLRIDPLDALVNGLDHAFHVSRVRKLVPSYRQLEALQNNYVTQAQRIGGQVSDAANAVAARERRIAEMLGDLFPDQVWPSAKFESSELRERVADRSGDEFALSTLAKQRGELAALKAQVGAREANSADLDIAIKQRVEAEQLNAFETWSEASGAKLLQVLDRLRGYHKNLPQPDIEFVGIVGDAITWCSGEIARLDRVLSQHDLSGKAFKSATIVVERATTRIREINKALAGGAKDARTLANALAGIAPHVEGDFCPVCHRDYGEEHKGPLTAHIAATIASLTSEAGRLQAMANERANESEQLSRAQRDVSVAQSGVLPPTSLLNARKKRSDLVSIRSELETLLPEAQLGSDLGRRLAEARVQLGAVRRAQRYAVDLLPEIETEISRATGRSLSSFETPARALDEAVAALSDHMIKVETKLSRRVSLTSELGQLDRELGVLRDRRAQDVDIARRIEEIKSTISDIASVRDKAKTVASAATMVRTNIVRSVFSGSLNKVWRDLFVRLAPAEEFVPQFKLPEDGAEKVEAVLETLHRSGRAAGTPGAMLSQGNLNTAALTLFLALNLSVPPQLPWLVLDDPVQSMDDVHIAQFAALLRTLSKSLNKQVVVAVHERALFDYLTLELSPAFPGDSLIAVEISRSFDGTTIADPKYLEYVDDKAVAA